MGNNHSLGHQHPHLGKELNSLGRKGSMPVDSKSQRGSISTASQGKMGMPRSASGADINEKTMTQFVPVEKLAKVSILFCMCAISYYLTCLLLIIKL